MLKQWNMPSNDPRRTAALMRECGVGMLSAQVLSARGLFSYREASDFLDPGNTLESPFEIADMEKAAARIWRAIETGERIVIYGDYDCDGVTATAILYTDLQMLGADVDIYIPERETEGYGLNPHAVRLLRDRDFDLIITVDNGISAIDEIRLANELGMEVIVTDHHQPGDRLPDAFAIVNPHRPGDHSEFKHLCGAGVALKLVAALDEGDCEGAMERFGELAAIGTVGDVVPLTGENRIIVQQGLRALSCTEHPGIRALCEAAGRDITKLTAQDIAFALAPRINAAGRMGSAKLAFDLLTCEQELRAELLAEELTDLNRRRQDAEQRILLQVEEQLAKNPDLLKGRLLMLAGENWTHGVIGIVCARLMEKYGKPTLLMTMDENGFLRGSARSLGDFHLHKALSANASRLIQYGGHKLAAGFSLSKNNYAAFCAGMEKYAQYHFDLMPHASINVTGVVSGEELTVEAVKELDMFEPFGAENEAPIFVIPNAKIENATLLSQGKHMMLTLQTSGKSIRTLWFNMTREKCAFHIGDTVDAAVSLGVSNFRGTEELSVKLVDIRPSGFDADKYFNAMGYYEKLARKERVAPAIAKRALPTREEAAAVYRFLRANTALSMDAEKVYFTVHEKVNFCKLNILLDMLQECGLIRLHPGRRIELVANPPKAELLAAPTYQRVAAAAGETK